MGGAELKPLTGAPAVDVGAVPAAEKLINTIELIASRAILAGAKDQNVPSPCTSVCRMGELTGLCEGCYRTLDEIRQWSGADDQAKRMIWTHIEQRIKARPP